MNVRSIIYKIGVSRRNAREWMSGIFKEIMTEYLLNLMKDMNQDLYTGTLSGEFS